MVTGNISGVSIAGLASAVPERTLNTDDDIKIFGDADARKISENTGIRSRHVISNGTCTSDLCFAAAEQLLADLKWDRNSIDTLIFVSQTPDYLLPATSCSLHGRLGLGTQCAAFDVNLGCSGYIYGLWVASNLISAGGAERVLLLVGDTISRIVAPQDRSVAPLFGDAGTATVLERATGTKSTVFKLGTDGRGQEHLVVPVGGFRHPRAEGTAERTTREGGNIRSDEDLFMNGPEIFAFSLREVPRLIRSVLEVAGWSDANVDAYIMHQASRFMLQHLAKRLQLPADKLILTMENYGNTSSASIPLALTQALADRLRSTKSNLILAGFGVGLSWGAVALTCDPMVVSNLVIVPDQK